MDLTTPILWLLTLLITLVTSVPAGGKDVVPPPTCTDFFIPVSISAMNLFLPVTVKATGPVYNVSVHATFNIGAKFCAPGNSLSSRRDVLQLLVHGTAYDRNYWSGHDFQDPLYSWVDYASSQGYSTLSIDRLGNGLSDHPDANTVVQTPVHVEIIQNLITAARSGQLPGPMAGKKFSKIIYAGHSYGSVVANAHNAKYPSETAATILTGFTNADNSAFIFGTFVSALVPAALENPSKYGSLDFGYLTANISDQIKRVFYYPGSYPKASHSSFLLTHLPILGGYDPLMFALDYSLRGTIASGELAAGGLGLITATQYKNPVFVATGQHDAVFCTTLINNGQENDCGTTTLSGTKVLYPNVASRDFAFYAPPKSGHCWQLHYDALNTFTVIHQWLEGKGF